MREEEDGLNTREQILALALELMMTQGFEKTTIGQLAEGLGVSKAALYYHFNAKDDLLTALVDPYMDRLERLISEAPRSAHSISGRKELFGAYFDLLVEHQTLLSFLARDVSALHHPAVESRLQELLSALQSRVAGPRGGEAAKVRAVAALGTLLRPVLDCPGIDIPRYKTILVNAAVAVTRSTLKVGVTE